MEVLGELWMDDREGLTCSKAYPMAASGNGIIGVTRFACRMLVSAWTHNIACVMSWLSW